MKTSKGFTLVETLVVLAIIAVLATVVMVNITQYINKGKDSAIKDNMAVLMAIAALHFDGNGSFDGFCSSANALRVQDQIENNIGTTYFCNISDDNAFYAACAVQLGDSENAWCVDNTGVKRQIDSDDCNDTLTVCP